MDSPRRHSADSEHVMTLYGQSMTRAGGVFAIGIAAIVPFGIVSLGVTTRYLSPAEFGQLTVLFTVASVLTVLCGLGFFQGTFMSTYGISDDGDDGGGDLVDDQLMEGVASGTPEASSDERRRLLGTGLLVIIVLSTVLCAIVGILGGLGVGALFGQRWTSAVEWMAASAWTGAIWRMMSQIPRMERRAGLWTTLQFLRPALVLVATIAALAMGLGINGVLAATAGGTLIGVLAAFVISRRCFRFAPKRADVSALWEVGRPWVPLTFAVLVQANVSILLLGILASPASVGLFQAANRIAQLPSFFADGFLTAWPTMELSPISAAAKERKGRGDYFASVFTLFCLSSLVLLVAISLLSDTLIHIAAPSYESAAPLIPVVAVAYGAQAVFRGVYRATQFPARRYWFTLLHLLWIVPYGLSAALLISINPSYGVAIAQVVAGVIVCAWFVWLDKRTDEPTPFQWRRLGYALLVAFVFVVLVQLIPAPAGVHAILSLAALFVFPAALVATRTVSRAQIGTVLAILRSLVPKRESRAGIVRRFRGLNPDQQEAVRLIAAERRDPADAAERAGVTEALISARFVRGLRSLADAGEATPVDHLLSNYVLHPGSTLERDTLGRHLQSLGVDPLQLHTLDDALGMASRLRTRSRSEPAPGRRLDLGSAAR
jgi:O-antigen/teichoic acid export membrane protein